MQTLQYIELYQETANYLKNTALRIAFGAHQIQTLNTYTTKPKSFQWTLISNFILLNLNNAFTPPSPPNISVIEKTKLLTPHLITFIHQDIYYQVICVQIGTAQNQIITTLATCYLHKVNSETYTPQCPPCLSHTHDTHHLFKGSQVQTQHNITSL